VLDAARNLFEGQSGELHSEGNAASASAAIVPPSSIAAEVAEAPAILSATHWARAVFLLEKSGVDAELRHDLMPAPAGLGR
jgi:hypothetical protein